MACLLGALGALGSCVAVPLTSLAGCVACQACSCLASSICSCCCSSLFCSSKREDLVSRSSRFIYLFLFIISTIVAGVLRDQTDLMAQAASRSDIISQNMLCPSTETGYNCMGRVLVLRICFGTFLFHLILATFTFGASDYSNPRVLCHTGLWPVKILLWIVLHLAMFFMPSTVFLGFQWPALICAILFLLTQTVIFIEWIYEINEKWIEKDGAENITGPWHILILTISFFCLAGSVVMSAYMFMWFGPNSGGNNCGVFTFFTAFNMVLFVFLTMFSFRATSWMHETGLLPSALIAAFLTFKVLMALFAQSQCNAFSVQQGASYASPAIVNIISIIIAILVSAFSSIILSQDLGDEGRFWGPTNSIQNTADTAVAPPLTINNQQDRATPLLQQTTAPADIEMQTTPEAAKAARDANSASPAQQEAGEVAAEANSSELKGPVGYSIAAFHMAFMLGVCYVAMQLTDWNEKFPASGSRGGFTVSMWIKIADSWVLAIAFGWSMIAPLVCSGRDFSG